MAEEEGEISGMSREEQDSLFWAEEYHRRGMAYADALTLAFDLAVDRHAVREALERGCRPELAFEIYST